MSNTLFSIFFFHFNKFSQDNKFWYGEDEEIREERQDIGPNRGDGYASIWG